MSYGWEPDDVVSVIEHLNDKYGQEALDIIKEALFLSAAAWGKELAQKESNGTSPKTFIRNFTEGPKATSTIIEEDDNHAIIETTKCRSCEIFKELGKLEIGYQSKCLQDYGIIYGYNQNINLTIEKCMMKGDRSCIHHYKMKT